MFFYQTLIANRPRAISRVMCAIALISSEEALAKANLTKSTTSHAAVVEEMIASARSDELSKIEIKLARMLQENPRDVYGTYLMSTLLLRMFTTDPGNYALIRQSTELAAQTYDLDKKSDLAIAALANILEVTGENDRGLALINDSNKQGVRLGWRSKLAKARLMFDGRNTDAVLSILDEVLKDPESSLNLTSNLLIDAISSRYEGSDQISMLREWRSKCATLSMDLAIAGALSGNGEYLKASALYEQISKKYPHNYEALLSYGVIAVRSPNQFDKGVQKLRLAIAAAKDPLEQTAAQAHLALALISKNRSPDESATAAVNAVAHASDQETTLVAILAAYRRHSSSQTLLGFLNRLDTAAPGLHLAHALKAEILSEKFGKHHEATRSFTNAITLDPTRSEYYNGRGLAWMGVGKLDFALEDFESASAVNPEDASARYNTACAQARLGLKEEALSSLAQALSLDENLAAIAKTDSDLRSLRGDNRFQGLIDRALSQLSVAH